MTEQAAASERMVGNPTSSTQEILSAYFTEETQENDDTTAEVAEEEQPVQAESAETTADDAALETGAEEEAEVDQITIAELAESLDLDPEALYATQVVMEDGTRVPLGTIKDTWQEARQAQRQNEATTQQIEQQRQQAEAYQAQLHQQAMMMQLNQPDQEETGLNVEWDRLNTAENDQAFWSEEAKKDSGATALALQRVQQAKRDLESKITAKRNERAMRAQQLQQQYHKASKQEIHNRVPGWSNQESLQKDWGEIAKTLHGYGMTQPQIDSLWIRPPLMHLMRDHVELLRKVGQANPKKKVVLPKNIRAGARKSEASANKAKLDGILERAKSGDRKAQTAAVKALIGG